MIFLKQKGLKLKVERGNRVFPMSDRSADVLDTLRRAMRSGRGAGTSEYRSKKCTEAGRRIHPAAGTIKPLSRRIK